MKAESMRALRRIQELTEAEWMAVAGRARLLGVAGWRWDGAWEAAAEGHDAGALAFRLATDAGATRTAAAAAAGAIAALETGPALSEKDRSVLVEPLRPLLDEPATAPARFEQVWVGLRRFQATAVKPIG